MSDGEEVDYSPDEPREDGRRRRRESSSGDEDTLAGVREVRRRRLEQENRGMAETSTKYEVPERVTAALKRSKTFNDYKRERVFRFLHLFSGKKDVLGREVLRLCHAEGLKAEVCALDREREGGPDMLADQPYQDLVRDAAKGDFDASHAGYPCGSFSRVRYVETEGMPGPVRSLQHIYGLPTNSPKQQKEADQGTIMCVRSLNVTAEVIQAQRRRGVPEAATLENPPGSETAFEGPSWELPESKHFQEQFNILWVDYNTCAFQKKERTRWFKPGRFAGRLKGLDEMARPCTCPSGFEHQPLRGRERTAAAAEYPRELCEVYAKLLVKVWKTTLNLEWWRSQAESKEEEVNRLQKAWMVSKEKRLIPKPIDRKEMEQRKFLKRAYEGDDEMLAGLPQRIRDSQKVKRELENNLYLGGMRNPGAAVARMNILADAGKDIRRLWKSFVEEHPEALEIARTYGTERCRPDETVASLWKEALGKMMRALAEPPVLRDRWSFKSPLDPAMWDAWRRFSKDPEESMAQWARHGVPLGMSQLIPSSNGVFPPVEMEEISAMPPELEEQLEVANYRSMHEDMEAAKGELDRYIEKGFAVLLDKGEAAEAFGRGTVSKLALISKLKEGPQGAVMKHRIIIDMLRSGGNGRAKVPERITLPRVNDMVKTIQKLWRERRQDLDEGDPGVELVGADLSDAYCHFGVAGPELKNCLAPADPIYPGQVILFRAMLFGFKGAPLIMGRLAAAFSRLWQAMLWRDKGSLQTYMDDPLVVLMGSRGERRSLLAMLLYTAKAFGINLAFHKGERGLQLTWVGVRIEVRPEDEVVTLVIPDKMIKELRDKLKSWHGKGMIGLREVRQVTGRLSWLAGILPRCRWCVTILYSVMASVEHDRRTGEEARRAEKRADNRPKEGLVPVKRMALPMMWFLRLLEEPDKLLLRSISLSPQQPHYVITTDASPFGIGGILAAYTPLGEAQSVMACFSQPINKDIADFLGVKLESSSSQGALEAWAVLVALRRWKAKLRGQAVFIKSDSMVALAVLKKFASSSATLNWIGGELALFMEKWQMPRLVPHHIAGKLNVEADWLSRPDLQMKEPVPQRLHGMTVGSLTQEQIFVHELPPPGVNRHLWGEGPELNGAFEHL